MKKVVKKIAFTPDEWLIVTQIIERLKIANKKDLIIALENEISEHSSKDNPFAFPGIMERGAGIGLMGYFLDALDKIKKSDID